MNGAFGNLPAPAQQPFQPGGYLTLVSGTPVITSDQASKTVVYYTPDKHGYLPIIKNGVIRPVPFDEIPIALTSAHALSSIVDVFGIERNGKGWAVTGPAWTTATAGSGARGTGGGTTELIRNPAGVLVNRWGIPGLNGAGSSAIGPLGGIYLGSLFIDGTAGQVTCHRSFGQSRKFGVWNGPNRRPITLSAGDATASWTNVSTWRASNGSAANSLSVFCGLAEEGADLVFKQNLGLTVIDNEDIIASIGIGVNATNAASGKTGQVRAVPSGTILTQLQTSAEASFYQAPALGINTITSLENLTSRSSASDTITHIGGAAHMLLTARWMG